MSDVKPNGELRIHYGDRTNTELLVYSGFVMKPLQNASHKATVWLDLPLEDSFYKVKMLLLSKTEFDYPRWADLNEASSLIFARIKSKFNIK